MVGVSVIQVANAVRHTPLPSLLCSAGASVGPEDSVKGLGSPVSPHHVLGGFIGGGQLAWRAAGPTVELIDPDRGTRKAAWTFGAVLHNNSAQVTSVCGVGKGLVTHVVVGVDLGVDHRPRGLVALLSLLSSRVTRAFHFEHKVTKLCMVSGGEVSVDSGTLAPELRHWQGLVVVGTAHGTLHLLDLALDLGCHKVLSDEVSPGSLLTLTTPDPAAEHTRVTALRQQCHPTMCLSEGMSYNGRFQLIGPDENVLFEVASHQVVVTALAFFSQLASLVVGYNFGAFQIINLSTLTIDCASPYEENMPPVLSFACQEPENDPKNFVYLWLCRSCSSEGTQESSKPARGQQALCTMYAMSYDNKAWIEGHGLWYQGLASISPRFEFDVLGGLGLKGQPVGPSCVFSSLTVQLTTPPGAAAATAGGPTPVAALTSPDEDSGTVLEQSLCLFGWVGGVMEKGCLSLNHYLAVFDINQWYQAHMPSTLKLEESQLCPFMSFHLLDRVPGISADGSLSEVVLGAVPKPASWAQHTSHTCNDSDWFPAALSYDAFVLTSDSLVEYRCQSAQQAALALLTSCGPAAIVSPEEAHAVCVFAGLIPVDGHHNNASSTVSCMMLEREALLNVALDQQLVSLLVQCVTEFSEGRFTNLGCSLPSLLDWAWGKVSEIKASSDNLCLPLFDPDSGVVSSDTIAMLHQNLTSLTTLNTIVTTIRDHAHSSLITLQGAGELESRVRVVRLILLHLGAVLWFYHCGLLTPSPIEDPGDECSVPFPAELLSRIYRNRRREIRNLSATLNGSEILMIDGLLEEATAGSGGSMGKAWEEEEEAGSSYGTGRGMYPPPSLHAVLNMFLLPDVPSTTKHRIVQYLFLDLASLLSDGYARIVEELVKYPSSFSLSPSLIKLTQAFWLLDHKDFQEGLNVLLDPLVNPCDITPWQHRRIMKAFLYQGEHGRALTYAKMRQPPKVDIDDIRLHLTLLLANGLVREAFHYQRSHRTTANTQDLLQHFYTGCEQQGRLESVIHLPLSSLEEAALVNYLRASASTAAHDYLLVYYLQRARYDDAALLQDGLRGGLGTARRRHGARSALVHGYLTHLPDVAKRLSSGIAKRPAPVPTIYKKPPPLSAHIRQSIVSTKSRATSLERQLSTPPPHTAPFTPFKTAAQRRRAYELADLDNYEVLLTPRKKESSRDASHVVFPTLEDLPNRTLEGDVGEVSGVFSPAPPAKRSRLTERSLFGDSILKAMESTFRRSSMHATADTRMSLTQNISADMLSLLETPKVKRRRRTDTRPDAEATLTDTPQSILKVRQMVQRPLSPSAASDASLPVFPRLSARKAKISAAATAAIAEESAAMKRSSVDTSLTPKQLRFSLPKVQVDEEAKAKGATRLLGAADQDTVEDEEEAADEEELEEEEEKEEAAEEDETDEEVEDEGEKESLSTSDVEEEAQRPVEKQLTSDSAYQRQNADQGVPTPRQPLHSHPAGSSPTGLSQKSLATKRVGLGSLKKAEEQQEESYEMPSRETSLNEMFYSFEEEESGNTANRGETPTPVEMLDEDEEEEEEGETSSAKREEAPTPVEMLDEDEEEEEGESSTTKREETPTPVEMLDEDEEEGETSTTKREEEEEVQEKDEDTDNLREIRSIKEDVSIEDHGEEESHDGAKEEVVERIQKTVIETHREEVEHKVIQTITFTCINEKMEQEKENEKSPELLDGEDKVVEDIVASPQADPVSQELISSVISEIAVPEKDKESPTNLTAKGEGVAMREDEGFSEEIEPPTEAEEGQEAEIEVEVEISSPERLVLPDTLRQEHKVEEREEMLESLQEGDEKSNEENGDAVPLLNILEAATDMQDDDNFTLEECMPMRDKKEEHLDHCITTQEEEMIADAISEGAEELYLNLDPGGDVSPSVSLGKESQDWEGEDKLLVQDVDLSDVKTTLTVKEDALIDEKNREALVDFAKETELVSSTEKEAEAVCKELIDENEKITEIEDAGPVMAENTELQILASTSVEQEATRPERKQPDETFVVDESHREVNTDEEEKNKNKIDSNESAISSTEQRLFTSDLGESKVADVLAGESPPEPLGEVDVARPLRVESKENDGQEENCQSTGEVASSVTEESVKEEGDVDMVDGSVKEVPSSKAEKAVTLTEADQEPPTPKPEERVVESQHSSSTSSPISLSKEGQGTMTVDPGKPEEKAESVDKSSVQSDEGNQALTPRRSTRHTPTREQATTPPRRSRRLSEASNSSAPSTPRRSTRSSTPSREEIQDSAPSTPRRTTRSRTPSREGVQDAAPPTPRRSTRSSTPSKEDKQDTAPPTPKRTTRSSTPSREEKQDAAPPTSRRNTRSSTPSREDKQDTAPPTPKRTTRSSTPSREDKQDAALERVTRSGRKIAQVPTPLIRSKGTPGSPLSTPGRRTRRLSGSLEEDVKKVSQKLHLTPESKTEEKDAAVPSSQQEEPDTAGTPHTPLLATPTRRSTRRSQVESLETISEDSEVVRLKSEGRARTPSKDTTTATPSKATPRRSRRLSTTETLETIAEDAVLTTTEGPLTPTPLRRSSRRSVGPQTSQTPQKRRASIEGASEEPFQVKTPRRTRQSLSETTKKTPQRRTPSKRKKTETDTPAEEAVQETEEESSSSVIPGEGRSISSRTRKRSISEESTGEGKRDRLDSLTSVPESFSASPARSTPVTSIKDSESSEEDDRKTGKQERKQKHAKEEEEEEEEEGESVKSKQDVTKRRKSRLLLHASAHQPLHLDVPKPRRKSTRTMKLYRDSEENDKYILDSEKKGTRRVSRARKSVANFSPPSSPVLLLGTKKSEAEIESSFEGVEVKSGLDVEDVFVSSESPVVELSLLKVGDWNKSRKRLKSLSSITGERRKRTRRRQTMRLPQTDQNPMEDEEDSSPSRDAAKKTLQRKSKITRRPRANSQFSPPSSPLLLNAEGKEVKSDSKGLEEEAGHDNKDSKEVSSTSEAGSQESPPKKQSSQGRRGRKRGKGQGQGSTQHSGKEEERNTITTTSTTNTTITTVTTTTRRSTQSKQRISSLTTTTELDIGLREEEGQKVDEERLKPQLSGKEEDETVMEERTEGDKHNLSMNNSATDSGDKGSTEEVGASISMPQFKFAEPKAVSKKRQMRGCESQEGAVHALEDLTNEAVSFLFSSPLAAGRNANREQTTTKTGSSSSESEADTRSKQTSRKKR